MLPRRHGQPKAETIGTMGALSAVGIGFVLAVMMGFGIGYLLDRWIGTSPLFTIVFFFFGLAAGIVNVVRTAARVGRDESAGPKPGK